MLKLVADESIETRFNRVVIASGDGIFTTAAETLQTAGTEPWGSAPSYRYELGLTEDGKDAGLQWAMVDGQANTKFSFETVFWPEPSELETLPRQWEWRHRPLESSA